MLLELGLGLCGLSPFEFYEMTLPELLAMIKGRRKVIEAKEAGEWIRVRWQTCLLLQPKMKKGKRLNPKDLIVFDWEKTAAPSKQEINASRERIIKKHGKVRRFSSNDRS
jgi:hypothetical protein